MITYQNNSRLYTNILHAFEFAQSQVLTWVNRNPDRFPMYTMQGKWLHSGEAWTHWCDGFLGGMMWIFYQRTKRTYWLDLAKHYSLLIEPRKDDRSVHDMGFLFWSTWKRWFDMNVDQKVQKVVIQAGQTLGMRFQEKGGYLCSFIGPNSLFIDIMMNIGIVFYAALQKNDSELLQKAHRHCQTTRRFLVRGDGSTAHEGLFDCETGEFLRQSTHQGWRGDSTWARGQAWALYGFGSAFALTGKRDYLDTACFCAEYFLQHCSFQKNAPFGPGIPPNDFDDPRQPLRAESSAAAIAASGLLQLAEIVRNKKKSRRYLEAALTILDTLSSPRYLAESMDGWEGILLHGIYHLNKGLGVDESVMWGDYFFVEALDKALSILEQEL